jgi:leader peptidase (prepilin peptidase)/N-methyltransferase
MAGIAFVGGLLLGSFLNVCAYRLPLRKNLIKGRSFCPSCGSTIRATDNIPVLSYILLRGRCRDCGGRIPLSYPLIELTTGFLALFLWTRFGELIPFVFYLVWGSLLILAFVIDLKERIIPDPITLGGIPIGIASAFFIRDFTIVQSILGMLIGGGSLFLIGWIYEKASGVEGMGMGDVKLMAMIGAFVGWKLALLTIFLSSLVGAIFGLILILATRSSLKAAIPYGVFIAPAAFFSFIYGQTLLNWYFRLIRFG